MVTVGNPPSSPYHGSYSPVPPSVTTTLTRSLDLINDVYDKQNTPEGLWKAVDKDLPMLVKASGQGFRGDGPILYGGTGGIKLIEGKILRASGSRERTPSLAAYGIKRPVREDIEEIMGLPRVWRLASQSQVNMWLFAATTTLEGLGDDGRTS
ncbi:hypothetical protein SISNIDRAFT_471393 [Sistotremastrum niveocremeum HHB9708]|uniref:Uncharacterized protein n=1 Tax=Sistotremastrum niveocremeum HHB9708 TaxID=1314777 RepID=A0A164MPD1_9AGAM|nr:hypothetical protein SISNIDRAFT_471393 [Sistotremastrum niveocremeum HHB9708]